MSSKEGKDSANFLIFLFSMPIRVPVMEKHFLNNCIILVLYPRYLVCVSRVIFCWPFKIYIHHYSLCHMELTPWTSLKGSLALWLPVGFNHRVLLKFKLRDRKASTPKVKVPGAMRGAMWW